jgi:asparagine synthase (glutamine-hydrolysing)
MRFFRIMLQKDPATRLAWLLTIETQQEPPERVLGAELRREVLRHDPFSRYRTVYAAIQQYDPVQQLLYTDTSIMMPDTYFEKVDKSTMAHSIEVRVPYLDKDLTDYVLGLPSRMKLRGGKKKRMLRAALRGVVPDVILDGPKTGFGVPYGWWLQEPLHAYLKSVLLDTSVLATGMLDRKVIEKMLVEHASGRRDHGFMLYKLLNLALWWKFYLSGSSSAGGIDGLARASA